LQHELSNYTLVNFIFFKIFVQKNFFKLTHGFGGRMFVEVLETVLSVIVEADKILKTKN